MMDAIDVTCTACTPHVSPRGRKAVKMTLSRDGLEDVRYFYVPGYPGFQTALINRFALPTKDEELPTAVGRRLKISVAQMGKYQSATLLATR